MISFPNYLEIMVNCGIIIEKATWRWYSMNKASKIIIGCVAIAITVTLCIWWTVKSTSNTLNEAYAEVGYNASKTNETPSATPENLNSNEQQGERLTLAKFEEIENGMTYDEVVAIIGCEGTLDAAVGEKGTEYYTESYMYTGKDQVDGSLGAKASFAFQGGKLAAKAQAGLN